MTHAVFQHCIHTQRSDCTSRNTINLIFRILNLTILYNAQANVFSIQNVFVLEFTLKMFSSDFSTQTRSF